MPENKYRIVRSKRKTLALTVDYKGNLIVRAPLELPEKTILEFIWQKRVWIAKKQEQALEALEKYQPVVIETGARLMFLGDFYVLQKDPVERIQIIEDKLVIPDQCNIAQIRSWLKMQALEVLAARTAFYAKIMDVEPNSIKISKAKTRWGSCSANNNLNYAWRLIMCPVFVIDYVVVHELSHITIKNHSSDFWGRVASVLPNYLDAQNWLKVNKYLMEVI